MNDYENLGDLGREDRRKPRALSTMISVLISSNPRLRAGYELYQIRKIWLSENQEYIRRCTEEFILDHGSLTIVMNNSALRMEFNAMRERIRENINASMGYEAVKRLRFR